MKPDYLTPPAPKKRNLTALFTGLLASLALLAAIPLLQYYSGPPVTPNPPNGPGIYPMPEPLKDPPPPPVDEVKDPDPIPPDPEPYYPSIRELEIDPNTMRGNFNPGTTMGDLVPIIPDDDPYIPSELTRRPEPISTTRPVYPAELRGAKIAGEVIVRYVVTPEGLVTRITIEQTSHELFSDSVISALRKWRFRPGEKDGRVVASWVRQSFPFRVAD
jgi:protein TonB